MDSLAALIIAVTGFLAFLAGVVQSIRKSMRERRALELEKVKLEGRLEWLTDELADEKAENIYLRRQLEVERGHRP